MVQFLQSKDPGDLHTSTNPAQLVLHNLQQSGRGTTGCRFIKTTTYSACEHEECEVGYNLLNAAVTLDRPVLFYTNY